MKSVIRTDPSGNSDRSMSIDNEWPQKQTVFTVQCWMRMLADDAALIQFTLILLDQDDDHALSQHIPVSTRPRNCKLAGNQSNKTQDHANNSF